MAHGLESDREMAGAFRVQFKVHRDTMFSTASESSANNCKAPAVPTGAVARVC